MKKFIIGCFAMLAVSACNKDESSSQTQAADAASQDAVVEVAQDATQVSADATEVVDAGTAVSPTEDVSTTK